MRRHRAVSIAVSLLILTTVVGVPALAFDTPAPQQGGTPRYDQHVARYDHGSNPAAVSVAGVGPSSDVDEVSGFLPASSAGPVAPGRTAGSIRDVNPLGGTQNCVNCAIATDARLAGNPASALDSVGPQPISILEQHYGSVFKPVAGRSEIESLLLQSGSGARGIVFGARGADPGHAFNAVNQGGTIRFLDGQSGTVASFDGFTDFYFLRTGP